MPRKDKNEDKLERLAKGVRADKAGSRTGRKRKSTVRTKPGLYTLGTLAHERNISPLARLMGALGAEKIKFQLIGMSAAVLQGAPVATIDVDFWLDLPARQYMRAVNVARSLGATMLRNTIVELTDGTLVNFIYEVTGLKSFSAEYPKAKRLEFHGLRIPVMPLESIRRSKAAVMRPKDPSHIFYIDQTLRLIRANKKNK
jgi:hypothetical protein